MNPNPNPHIPQPPAVPSNGQMAPMPAQVPPMGGPMPGAPFMMNPLMPGRPMMPPMNPLATINPLMPQTMYPALNPAGIPLPSPLR